jgi:ComF family protein
MRTNVLHGGLKKVQAWVGQDCILCGSESSPEFLCVACAAGLPILPEHCPRCALPTASGAACGSCLGHPPYFDATTALWRYEFPCDKLVQALKYQGRLAIARCLARCLAAVPLPQADMVIPVPLHPKRLKERGFNQALEIARCLARYTGIPCQAGGVWRARNTRPQTELPYEERAKNARGAFACALDLSGKTVAVLDDVMTTGATLNELARILKQAGARRIENIVVARTVAP